MKDLNEFGVLEINIEDVKKIDGGSTCPTGGERYPTMYLGDFFRGLYDGFMSCY